jgi:hypothetical protein
MKYLVSLDKAVGVAPEMWRRYYTVGNLKVTRYDKKNRYVILRLENFRSVLMGCQILIGYFSCIIQMIINKKVTCKETKCVFRGDEYDEFLLKW